MENSHDFGLIYGLTNPYFEGMVKIGATRSLDINKRMAVLGTAVPVPFKCAFAYKVPHEVLFSIEHTLHETYSYCRMPGSEFFKVDPAQVDNLLRKLGKFEPMTTVVQEVIDTEEVKRKSPNMDFIKMGLKVGDVLVFTNDKSITCRIATNKKVTYENQEVSLSKLTQQILAKPYGVQPSPYWETESGVLLTKLYVDYVAKLSKEASDIHAAVDNAAKEALSL